MEVSRTAPLETINPTNFNSIDFPALGLTLEDQQFDPQQFAQSIKEEIIAGKDLVTISQKKREQDLAQGKAVAIGAIAIAEKTISQNTKKARKAEARIASGVSAMMASGCCGGHSSSSSSSGESNSTNSHENCAHCECGGHIINGKCDSAKCFKKKTQPIINQRPIDLTPVYESIPPPIRRTPFIPSVQSRREYPPRQSIIETAKAKKQRAIVMLFGAYVYYL